MKKMIWVPDDLVEEIKAAAKADGRSVSNYLVQLHRDHGGNVGQLERDSCGTKDRPPDSPGSSPGPASKEESWGTSPGEKAAKKKEVVKNNLAKRITEKAAGKSYGKPCPKGGA